MKKVLFFSVCSVLALFSCKKDGSSPSTISADVNGTPETFNTNAAAVSLISGGFNNLTVSGFSGAASSSDEIDVTVGGANAIGTGTFVFNPTDGSDGAVMLLKLAGGASFRVNPAASKPLSVTISSITASTVQGTFSGSLYSINGTDTTFKTVTNGQFSANY